MLFVSREYQTVKEWVPMRCNFIVCVILGMAVHPEPSCLSCKRRNESIPGIAGSPACKLGGPAEFPGVLSYAVGIYFLQWCEVLGLGSWSKKKVLHHKIADMHSFKVVHTRE